MRMPGIPAVWQWPYEASSVVKDVSTVCGEGIDMAPGSGRASVGCLGVAIAEEKK